MLVRDKFLPVFGPDTETGTADADNTPPPAGGTGGTEAGTETSTEDGSQEQQPNGPGSGRSKIRQQLENASAQAKKGQQERDKGTGKYQSRARQEQEPGTEAGTQQQEPGTQQQPGTQQAPQTAAPEAWAKEAKDVWAQLPAPAQAAVLKREQDVAAGVANLKKQYAEIDEAVKPYVGAIQQHKITTGAAVKQLFSWMDALTKEAGALKAGQNPTGAFAALAQSYGIDPVKLLAHMVQNPAQRQQPGQQQQPGTQQNGLDPNVKAYIDQVFGKVNQSVTGLETTVQQQNFAKTNEMLSLWSKDKPYFEDVRQQMSRLLSPGPNGEPAAVPPLANGNADLDAAYDMAVWGMPAVRAKLQADQKAAEDKKKADAAQTERDAQKKKLEAARKASGSIAISAPGVPGENKGKGQRERKSVKESILDAVKEVTER